MAQHVIPLRVYYAVFAALLVLTAVTTAVAYLDLGLLNTVVAMTIAVCKAFLVVLYFMHARYGARLTWIFIGAGVLWLAIMLGLTVSDVVTRPWLPVPPPWAAAAAGPDGPTPARG